MPTGETLSTGGGDGRADDGSDDGSLAFAHADRAPLPYVARVDATLTRFGTRSDGKLVIDATLGPCVTRVTGPSVAVTSSTEPNHEVPHVLAQPSATAVSFDAYETVSVPMDAEWHRLVFRALVAYDPACVAHEFDALPRVVHQVVILRREGDSLAAYPGVLGTDQRCVNRMSLVPVSPERLLVEAKPSGECALNHKAGDTLAAQLLATTSGELIGWGNLTFDGAAFTGEIDTFYEGVEEIDVRVDSAAGRARPVGESVRVSMARGSAESLVVSGELSLCTIAAEGYSLLRFDGDERLVGAVSSVEIDFGQGFTPVSPSKVRDGRRWDRVYCGDAPSTLRVRLATALGHTLETEIASTSNEELCGFEGCTTVSRMP